jgi:apolipoprotein N-acyltransferase
VALLLAVAAGLTMLARVPAVRAVGLAPVSVALLAAATHRRRLRGAAASGMVAGWCSSCRCWPGRTSRPAGRPWALLSTAQAAVPGPARRRERVAVAAGGPVAGALAAASRVLWVAQEAFRDRGPFGGFPWGRLAFSQGDAPALRCRCSAARRR